MKTLLTGRADRPAVTVVGVWDPLLATQVELLRSLACHARARGLRSVVTMIDPPPAYFRFGPAGCQMYHDARARLELLRETGVDGIVLLKFNERDVDAGAAELFAALRARMRLAEIWLGARQSLGRGERGHPRTVAALAPQLGIEVTNLPEVTMDTLSIQQALAAGATREAARLVGRPPLWSRPKSGLVRCAWRAGHYRAVPVARDGWQALGTPIDLCLTPEETGMSVWRWPDRGVDYYAFVAGPADRHVAAPAWGLRPRSDMAGWIESCAMRTRGRATPTAVG